MEGFKKKKKRKSQRKSQEKSTLDCGVRRRQNGDAPRGKSKSGVGPTTPGGGGGADANQKKIGVKQKP